MDRKKVWIVLFLAAAGLGALLARRNGRPADVPAPVAADRPLAVRAYRVRPRRLEGVLQRNGTVRPRAETNLQFGAGGRIARFDAEKGRFVKKGALIAELDAADAESLLEAAELEFQRASVKYFQDRTIDKIEYERAKLRYNQARRERERTALRAPHDGYLVEKTALAGEHVQPGAVVGRLMDKSRVFVEMSLAEKDIAHLKEGQKVAVTVDAVPGFKADGRVASITPYLDGNARSFAVKVSLPDNPGEALSPGMYARCAIRRYVKDGALTVPVEAAVEAGETAKLFTVSDRNTAALRSVRVLFSGDRELEVEGLADGDLVVVGPPLSLRDGSTVAVESAFDPAAAGAAGNSTGGKD